MSNDIPPNAANRVRTRLRSAGASTIITWLAIGFVVQHAVGMLTSLLCLENETHILAYSRSFEWWPGGKYKFWDELDWLFELPPTDYGIYYPGFQPPIAIEGACGTVGVWRCRQVRDLWDQWAFVSPVTAVNPADGPNGYGWASLAIYEQWRRSPPEGAESHPDSAYYAVHAYLREGNIITLDPPSWVAQPKCSTVAATGDAPTIMQFSAAWGLPFRSVVHHATLRWVYEFTLPQQHAMERYLDAWELLEYDGIQRGDQRLLFNAGVGWRPIWSGGLLNAIVYGGALFLMWKMFEMARLPNPAKWKPTHTGSKTVPNPTSIQ